MKKLICAICEPEQFLGYVKDYGDDERTAKRINDYMKNHVHVRTTPEGTQVMRAGLVTKITEGEPSDKN